MKTGDKVNKKEGYKFPGTVVAVFKKTTGETRVVVEMDEYGLLHIFNPEQLKVRGVGYKGKILTRDDIIGDDNNKW